jgi:DNA modification methylase
MNDWPADKVERRAVASLIPYAKNARTHSPAQIGQIAASIKEWGWTVPVLLDERDGIIAGHGRVLAAKKLGLVDVPCMVARGWSDAQRKAYALADNQLSLNAGWDEELLALEIAELQSLAFDTELIGFDDIELARILAERTGKTDPDDAPEPPAVPVSALGDLWLLGDHRLVCGDSTTVESVDKALGGARPHLMVTDPPYGVEYDANWRNEPEKLNLRSHTALGGVNAKKRNATIGKVLNDDRSDWTAAWALYRGDVAYVWHGERQGPDLAVHFRKFGFEPRNLIVWAKDGLVISRGHYHPQHEGCWYLVRKGATGHWAGDRKQSTLWQIPKNRKNETGHSAQKPVECMRRPIENNSRPGDSVYEPFSGSGTTIIAGEMTGRRVLAIELSPVYVDVAVERWQNFTGREATHAETGETFGAIKVRRHGEKAA